VMAVIVVAALRIYTDGNAGGGFSPTLLGRGMGWGNAGVGTLAVGFVPGADVQLLIFWHVCALLELVGFSAHCWHFANCS
ncbi:hypothetical protein ACTWOG_001179, partial [Serratia marcescens]